MHDPIGDAITQAAPDALAEKAELPALPMLVLGIAAGAFIGFGSIGFLVAQGIAATPAGAVSLLSGLAFSVGLILVMVTGAELFTGNTMMQLPLACRRLTPGAMLRAWGIVWIGNLIGGVAVAALFVAAGGADAAQGLVGVAAVEVADTKIGKGAPALLASGVLANMLVCLAVWMAMAATSIPSKVLAIVGPVTLFVAAGFEHSVANMSLLPIAWGVIATDAAGLREAGFGAAELAAVDLPGIVRNLVLATVGNVVGGGLVALGFGYAQGVLRKG